MSFTDVSKSSEKLIEAWGVVPIAYDGVDFTAPSEAPWCRTYVIDGDSFNNAISDKCIRRTGLVIVQIFTPSMIGSRGARDLADQLSTVFTNQRDGSVQYYVAYATRVGYVDNLYQLNLSIPFQLDEVLP